MKALAGIMFILILNVLFFFASQSLINVGLANNVYTYEHSLIQKFNEGDTTNFSMRPVDLNNDLPQEDKSIDPSSSSWLSLTDIYTTLKNWVTDIGSTVLDLIPGSEYILALIGGLHFFLSAINLPSAIIFGIDFIWGGLTLFLVVMFLRGE